MKGVSINKKLKSAVFLICLAVLVCLGIGNALYEKPINEEFLHDYEEFDSWEEVASNPTTFRVSNGGNTVGYLVIDSHYGYQSEVAMATLVGNDGIVLDVRTYSQNETPSYYRKLIAGGFFKNNFVGNPSSNGFSVNVNVDAISHATISSNAVANAVQKGTAFVAEHFLSQEAHPAEEQRINFGLPDLALIGMFVLAIVASKMHRIKWLQWVTRIYSFVMMGFIVSQFITLSVLISFFSLDWPSIQDYLRWYIMVIGVFVLLVISGKNTYCSHMCPFGALQEIEFSLSGPLASPSIDKRVSKKIRYLPPLLLFVAVSATFVTHNLAFANYEPFSLVFGQVGVGIQWALLPLVLIGALFLRRFYCRCACPVGYVFNKIILGRNKVVRRIWKKRTVKEKA